ncbi:calcium/calmodulin-dependent protein kinase kinase 1 isoform X2 [Leptidea sinapis]|uniref:calcium/calmodulin-dependent protein kinase kinase 1 isoform X2 n=1 Tax=Leptidea sinapis TaxID=189913 RepID=UPI00213C2E60|nr:calcium/calmodulin-dependent protein kinase kinase 1 isoform X2 [Leptidea sinapis]
MNGVVLNSEASATMAGNVDRHSAVDVVGDAKRDPISRRWQQTEGDRLSAYGGGDRSALLRSHAAKSAECNQGSPRARRAPRESRRVSLAQAPGYVQLNQYRLLEPIGQGSYGLVKLAYSEEDDTHYAMKILSKRKLMRRAGLFGRPPPRRPGPAPDPLQSIYREIAVLKKLDHPNVVKLVEVLDDPAEDQLYLVFQLLEGGPVVEVPSEQPLSEDLARKYFRDALLGVEYLHFQRIAHRDIKPANLLLGEGRVQVADLGACGELAAAGELSGAVGTPAFRAPEASATPTDKYNGEAADIWSLGVTLYAMVTGRLPWSASSVSELQRRILADPLIFPSRPTVSSSLRRLLSRMLEKDPVKRATMKEIKEHEWVTCDGQQPLPTEQENCRLVEVTEEDMRQVVTSIPNISTLILIKTMLKKHSFQNPFLRSRENSTRRESSETGDGTGEGLRMRTVGVGDKGKRGALSRAGRSLSAPGNYLTEKQVSFEINLDAVEEAKEISSKATTDSKSKCTDSKPNCSNSKSNHSSSNVKTFSTTCSNSNSSTKYTTTKCTDSTKVCTVNKTDCSVNKADVSGGKVSGIETRR